MNSLHPDVPLTPWCATVTDSVMYAHKIMEEANANKELSGCMRIEILDIQKGLSKFVFQVGVWQLSATLHPPPSPTYFIWRFESILGLG